MALLEAQLAQPIGHQFPPLALHVVQQDRANIHWLLAAVVVRVRRLALRLTLEVSGELGEWKGAAAANVRRRSRCHLKEAAR